MAVGYNPRAITDGLVLALDAGNPKNYNVGISTNWMDKVGGNNGTLVGGTYHTDGPFVGAGYVEFDGNGGPTSTGSNLEFSSTITLGTGDFTVETWIYNTVASQRMEVWQNTSLIGAFALSTNFNASDGMNILTRSSPPGSGWSILLRADTELQHNSWNHIAWVRSGGTLTAYLNGVADGNISSSIDSSPLLTIGGWSTRTNYMFGGNLSNLRIIKGTALYTSNFTPSTAPLTDVTNTKLLCCQSTTSAGAAAVSPNISGINNGTVWSSSVSDTAGFASGYPPSNAFDGSTSTQYRASTTNTTTTFTFPNISYSSSVEVHSYFNGSIQVNGQSAVSVVNLNDWETVASGSGTLSSITVTSSSSTVYVEAIRVDGVVLVDPVSANGNAIASKFSPYMPDNINTVRGQESGYATLNPLHAGSQVGLQNGNLKFAWASSGNYHQLAASTLAMPGDGKWYCEMKKLSARTDSESIGILREDGRAIKDGNGMRNGQTGAPSYSYEVNGNKNKNASGSSYGAAWSQGDVFGIAVDLTPGGTSGTIEFYKNGVSQGVAYSDIDTSYSWLFACDGYGQNGQTEYEVNFGQKPFKYNPPEGFKTLCLANLDRPTKAAVRPDKYFRTVRGSGPGTGSSTPIAVLWRNANGGSTNAQSEYYGKPAADANNDSAHPMFQWVKGLTIGGYTDWYIPAKHELEILFRNFKPTTDLNLTDPNHGSTPTAGTNPHAVPPTGPYTSTNPAQTTVTSFQSGNENAFYSPGSASYPMYWDATEKSTNVTTAGLQNFTEGMQRASGGGKSSANTGLARAIRRVAYTGSEPAIGAEYEGGFFAGLIDAKASPDGTATHALIVAPKSGGEYGVATSILDVAQRTFPNGLWLIKDRVNSNQFQFVDSKRGGNTALLMPNYTGPGQAYTSPSGNSVAWCWALPGNPQDNTDGDMTSTVDANVDAGFSIVEWTATSNYNRVGHGLGRVPDLILAKSTTSPSSGWNTFHVSIGRNQSQSLDSSGATASDPNAWGTSDPTDTTFGTGTVGRANNQSGMVAWCWASVPGYSFIGSYTGNASTDGPFVYCGFKPAFVLLKPISNDYWMIFDTARTTYNPVEWGLFPNDPIQETYSASYTTDLLSNGFKLRTSAWPNRSSTTVIFAAFAEAPSNNLFGGQANAR